MPTGPAWNSRQYLRFEAERTLPCRDLVQRIELEAPRRIVDLGCGPGTSTAVLLQRWPWADVVGVDSSPEMLEVARRSHPSVRWVEDDLRRWNPDHPLDLVFSNAVLQWVPDHPTELQRLWQWVAPGGAIAFQVPARETPAPAWLRTFTDIVQQPRWNGHSEGVAATFPVLSAEEYYDLFSPLARRVDLWDTVYGHVLPGPAAVVEWVRGTAIRPWLQELPSDEERAVFLQEYTHAIAAAYPERPDGRIVFPFRRRFVVAYRRA